MKTGEVMQDTRTRQNPPRHCRTLTVQAAANITTGQVLIILMQLLDILAPAWLAKEGIGQSGG